MPETKLTFEDVKALSSELTSAYGERDTMFDELEKMFLLTPDDLPTGSNIKKTLSPDPRNKLLGAIRLMTGTEPRFKVPINQQDDKDEKKRSDRLEKAALKIWKTAGAVRGSPVHYDAVMCGLLYGEVHIPVSLTSSLTDPRAEYIKSKSPVLFDVFSPRACYPVIDKLGLARHIYRRQVRVYDVRAVFPDALPDKNLTDPVTLNEYWSLTQHILWVDEDNGKALQDEPNTLGCIPIASVIAEGSSLFNQSGQQSRQPFLYSLYKSELWKRQNLALTVMYTMIFGIGSNPMFLYKRSEPDKHLMIDWDTPGGIAEIENTESLEPLAKLVIDPSIANGYQIASEQIDASTIYSQTLGQPLGANAPFSMVALLSQSGRLPLVPYQRMCSVAIARALGLAFELIRNDSAAMELVGLEPGDLETLPDLECTLDIDMPQDKAQMIQSAMMASGGEDPLISKRRAREDFLNIEQPEDEQAAIWDEKASAIMAQMGVEKFLQEQQAQQQEQLPGNSGMLPPDFQGMQTQPQGQPPQGNGLPPELAGMTPEQVQMLLSGGAGGVPSGAPQLPMTQPQGLPGQTPEGMI